MHSPPPNPVWRRLRSFRHSDSCLASQERSLLTSGRSLPSHFAPFRLASLFRSSRSTTWLLKPDSSSPAASSSSCLIPPSQRPKPSGHGPSDTAQLSDFHNAISVCCMPGVRRGRGRPPELKRDRFTVRPRRINDLRLFSAHCACQGPQWGAMKWLETTHLVHTCCT